MSDDLTDGDCRHGGGSDGARADCSRASGGAPACGQPGCRDRPEAEPRPCGSPRPPRAMPPGRLRSPPAAPGPRSRASPTLCRRLLGVLAGGHGVERGAGHAPGGADPPQAVGQTRAGRGGGTHRRDLRRPKGPKVSVLASRFHLHGQLSDPLHGAIRSACTGSPALLERGVDRSLSHATARRKTLARECTGSSAKAAERPACAPWDWPRSRGLPVGPARGRALARLPQAHRFSKLSASCTPWRANSVGSGPTQTCGGLPKPL